MILVRNYLFLKKYVTLVGVVSHKVLYYQQLSVTCYQVSFYGNIYFEQLPNLSSDFKDLRFIQHSEWNILATHSQVWSTTDFGNFSLSYITLDIIKSLHHQPHYHG